MIVTVATAIVAHMWGAPSRMRPVAVTGPDGEPVTVVAVGDEHSHGYEYTDGQSVEWLPRVERVKLTPAMKSRAANDDSPLRITQFPTKGDLPFLVVIVEFADKGFAFADPVEEFDALLNEPGYARYNGKGSVADFYRDNSAGQFRPRFDVVGPVKLSRGYAYYGSGSDDSAAGLMVMEACNLLDPEVDFSRYDLDGDGKVDNIYFYYAGKGEADGGDPATIWPHSWNISDQGRELTLDGVSIDAYACSPELDGSSKPNGIGTFCHEFGHVLGLPDLYASSYSSALHPATWSLMASGNYNDDGRTPPGLSSYERYELGWITPKELSYPLTVALQPLGESNTAFRISTERRNEYFLLENRQQSGWDSSLPGHGMLVWHIDYNPNIWDRNVVNNNAAHQYVDIVEANNATSHSQDAGFPFPGSARVTSLTSTTRPALVSWEGVAVDVPLTDIAESADGVITFDACGGKTPVGTVTSLTVTETGMEECSLQWVADPVAEGYRIRVYSEDGKQKNEYETDDTRCTITRLWPGNRYVARVSGYDRYEEGEAASVEIVMPEPTFSYLPVIALEATDVTSDSFTANWQPLADALSYEVTVNRVNLTESGTITCGFDGKTLPEGWNTNATSWSSVAGYYGTSAPALRVSSEGEFMTTSRFDSEVISLCFLYRVSSFSAGSEITVTGKTRDAETVTVAAIPVISGGEMIEIDNITPGICRLMFSFNPAGKTAVTIDDVEITLGQRVESPLPDWNPRDVGDATCIKVDGLEKDREYRYRVVALSAATRSLPSRSIPVTTTPQSGIYTITETSLSPISTDYLSTIDFSVSRLYTLDGRLVADPASAPAGLYLLITPTCTSKLLLK